MSEIEKVLMPTSGAESPKPCIRQNVCALLRTDTGVCSGNCANPGLRWLCIYTCQLEFRIIFVLNVYYTGVKITRGRGPSPLYKGSGP